MRVLFLTTNWPRPRSPVDGVFVREHARAVADRADVVVLHLDRSAGRGVFFDLRRLDRERPDTYVARYRRFGQPISVLGFLLAPFAAYRRLARAGFEPDVIHAHSFLSALPALALGRIHGKPVAYTEHWTIFLSENPGSLSWPMRGLAKLALERADIVLPVSDDLRGALADLAPAARFHVIPNVVDEGVFYPAKRSRADGPARLLTAGLLDTGHKGIDVLLEALARVQTPFILDVLGDGVKRDEYEWLAERLGLGERVVFRGLRPKEEVAEAMRSADVFVLGSRFENNPCVVIEALASGVPVVATAVGGVPEIVDEGSGLLARPRDPEDLAQKISSALERLDDFDRDAIVARALERYGRATVGRDLAEIYSTCLERRSR